MKLILIMIFFNLPFKALSQEYKISDHYNGKIFFNPEGPELKSFWTVMKWQFTSEKKKWPAKVPIKNYPRRPIAPGEKLSATFINHSSFLIEFQNLNLLTDPIYSDRASPFSFLGPLRVKDPGVPFDDLPAIDVVVVSHNHYDHLDLPTLKRLDEKFKPLFIVPLKNKKLLQSAGIQNIKELDWWESISVKGHSITLAPAQHWSARGLFDKNEALWGSFMIEDQDTKVYFAGDTGYGPHFKEIRTRLGAPDLSLIPIGAYMPEWFMLDFHVNPDEAVRAHLELESKRSVAMHFGTFQLSDEGIDDPLNDLKVALKKYNVPEDIFYHLEEGQTLAY